MDALTARGWISFVSSSAAAICEIADLRCCREIADLRCDRSPALRWILLLPPLRSTLEATRRSGSRVASRSARGIICAHRRNAISTESSKRSSAQFGAIARFYCSIRRTKQCEIARRSGPFIRSSECLHAIGRARCDHARAPCERSNPKPIATLRQQARRSGEPWREHENTAEESQTAILGSLSLLIGYAARQLSRGGPAPFSSVVPRGPAPSAVSPLNQDGPREVVT